MSAAGESGRWGEILEKSLDCVHCGLCLPACPTYRETGREISSPRGRIYLMRGVAEGRIELGPVVAEEAYLCLGCRACETACPSGVRFGSMLEQTRAEVEDAGLRSGWGKRLEWRVLRSLVPKRRRLHLLFHALAFAQRLGLDRLVLRLLPASLREAHAMLPRIPGYLDRRQLRRRGKPIGEPRGRVALFTGCVMRELYAPINRATARVLARNGYEVVVPRAQRCCGALHAHSGDEVYAHKLARKNAKAFAKAKVDAVVVNAAGCGAALRDARHWLPEECADLSNSVRDVSEFLIERGMRATLGRVDARVCYDDPCHLIHGQGVSDAPRELLSRIPGLELVPHDDPGSCCGAAGIYNVTHAEMSRAVLERKLDSLAAADPDYIATGNPGCLMQLAHGARERGLRAKVVHPIELLDQSYRS